MTHRAEEIEIEEHPEDLVELVHETLDQLNLLADRLESFAGPRPPGARTRRSDEEIDSDGSGG